jgi:enoyl-CoA hydratase/carnithine racemase
VQRLCPDADALLAEADAIADQMIQCNPDALRTIKRVVHWGADMTAEQAEKLALLASEATARGRAPADWQPPGR